MSLQEILAEHSRSIADNISHATDIASENAERKANTLEEKFQHVKDSIEGAGGDVAALGGAYHMGRKIFKKVKQARQAAQSIRGSGAEPGDNVKIDLPEGSSESGGNQSSKPTTSEDPAADSEAVTQPSDTPTAGESEGTTEPVQPEQAEAPESGGGGSEGQLASIKEEEPPGDLGRNLGAGEEDGVKSTRTVASVADEGADVGADAAGDVGETLAKTGANVLGKTSALVVDNADTATQAASKLAGIGGDALSAGLDTASAVLDALGPVGEVAGVITSLVGLFEGLGHKKKDVETTSTQGTGTQATSAAVDPEALAGTKTM